MLKPRTLTPVALSQVVSGIRAGVPAGRAAFTLNDSMTSEERTLVRRECALFMDADGFVSPAKLYLWFATGEGAALLYAYRDMNTSLSCLSDRRVDKGTNHLQDSSSIMPNNIKHI